MLGSMSWVRSLDSFMLSSSQSCTETDGRRYEEEDERRREERAGQMEDRGGE